MTEKLAGVIDAVDEDYFDYLVETDPVVSQKWDKLQNIYSENPVVKNPGTAIPPWRKQAVPEKKIHRLYWAKWAAACVALLLSFSVGYYLWNDSNREIPLVVSVDLPYDHINLQLSDGQRINLSDAKGNIQSGDVFLENENKTLSFSTANLADSSTNIYKINTLTVPVGLDYKITLSDGTLVWLNSATEIKFPFKFSNNTREVEVDGEAYFEVAKDINRPFIVHLPQSEVEVLGTTFNINTYGKVTNKVALIEGSVKMKTQESETRIVPGIEMIYEKGQGFSENKFKTSEVLGWQKGIFYFYDASLPEICNVIPRWFGINVVLDNPSIKSKRFAGILDKNQSIEVFLQDLQTITDIEFYFEEDGKELHFRIPETTPG
ncbi:MAG TPA: FecR domain-containing protein [Membranihabitans sp.]|nr:FecR domain-containing protein [Membranihabitans sp.]